MKWFKMWSEARNDGKLNALTPEEFRVWFNLMCFTAEKDSFTGILADGNPFLLAFEISGGNEILLESTLVKLEKLKIIQRENESIIVLNWKKRQAKFSSDSPEKTRDRKRKERKSKDVTTGHEKVTRKSREVTPLDTDPEEDKRDNNPLPPSSFSEPPPNTSNEVKNPVDGLVLAFHQKFPQHRMKYSVAGAAKLHDEITQMLVDGFTEDDILNRIDWIRDNECPAPWDLRTVDPPPYGRGRRFATEKEYQDWAISMV
ncbi:MAG: hypothetical protein AB2L14_25455 [Candidatus Xenobiia bacterium LiM19]